MPSEKDSTVLTDLTVIPQGGEEEREIDLVALFFHLVDNMKYIILALILGAVIAGLYTKFNIAPQYESTAKLYVLSSSDSVLNLSDLQIGNYLASDYQEVFKTWEVNEQVITNLGLGYSYKQLQNMLIVSNPSNTRILYVTVTSGSAQEAALIANEYADVARKYIANVMLTDMPSVLSVALVNPKPISPSFTRNIVLGGMLGLLLAAGILVMIFLLDDKIKSSDDITRTIGVPVLSIMPVYEMLPAEEPIKKSKRRNDAK